MFLSKAETKKLSMLNQKRDAGKKLIADISFIKINNKRKKCQ